MLRVTGFPCWCRPACRHASRVTAYDEAGDAATAYRGTVRFSSSDVAAGLPAEYTFTAADAGTHEFTATLRTQGTQVLSAVDVAGGSLAASQPGITVHAGDPWFLPIARRATSCSTTPTTGCWSPPPPATSRRTTWRRQSMRRRAAGRQPAHRHRRHARRLDRSTPPTGSPVRSRACSQKCGWPTARSRRCGTRRRSPARGRWDVVAAANGKAVTIRAGVTAVGVIDVPTDAYAYLPGADAFTVSRGADRRTVLLQSDTGVYLYDADSGAVILARTVPGLKLGFAGAAVNPDGTMLAVVTGPAAGQTSRGGARPAAGGGEDVAGPGRRAGVRPEPRPALRRR